ncbi:hypothetical protein ABB37_09038 [Leptomonas pyrrhocoris]|uniref:Uncharacterized protein n=1 Tax=Leptomonas pyrrhocoris TaxID=157538 RepID=A0A0M9FRS5_LEPPY|nr:hypothetical protein ABB37_09038 [Leptomonas pyrrhocoris]KPA74735.1 hypothetical protein ABB37_09038 [Leptomonas pyrrhocoris]|eukprot:XP_015653174.1 hypothetical protein ABB37_09038 [Leptomonas pyrrhocoris]
MISCAAIQKLERYGYLGLKRHSTEDFVATSIKDTKRVNVYALTLLETWKQAVQAVRGHGGISSISDNDASDGVKRAGLNASCGDEDAQRGWNGCTTTAAPARFTDALVYAMSFAVALTTQHVLEVTAAAATSAASPSALFPDDYAAALQLLTTLKEMTLAIGSGRALRCNASSNDFTKATAHLLTNVLDLVLVLFATHPQSAVKWKEDSAFLHEQMLAQGLVLTASAAQVLRRVQASYPVADLYSTRPCAALLKQVANKYKQQQKNKPPSALQTTSVTSDEESGEQQQQQQQQSLLALLRRYVRVSTHASTSASAANLFSAFSLFQRLSMLHGALTSVRAAAAAAASRASAFPEAICRASDEVQHWLSRLLSSTACNRATRYVVYFREDELRLMQHNIRQASEYALYTFTTTPPVDPDLVESLLEVEGVSPNQKNSGNTNDSHARSNNGSVDAVTHARAALVLAQWCVSAPFFFESFCHDDAWASFSQEQRRLVLLQQSRARRGLGKTSRSKKDSRSSARTELEAEGVKGSRSSSVSSRSSDTDSISSNASRHGNSVTNAGAAAAATSLPSHMADHAGTDSVAGSVTSLASRVSLLSTFSKHSAASYLSFLSVLRPSTTSLGTGGEASGRSGGADEGGDAGGPLAPGERQLHESEDGNTNLPLILLEQLTLGLHRFMETYPVELLDAYGLRGISWSCIARMFAVVKASLMSTSAAKAKTNRNAAVAASAVDATGKLAAVAPLFSLPQDLRYNKGMGYECLGLLFAKVVAPLLDVHRGSQTQEQVQQHRPSHMRGGGNSDHHVKANSNGRAEEDDDVDSRDGASSDAAVAPMRSVDGASTEEDFFVNAAAAASATVGRANLSPSDNAATRQQVEEALSTCLTAYETVAPQVVDMNLATVLRLVARTASAATSQHQTHNAADGSEEKSSVSWAEALLRFLQDVTRRVGRSNELPHFVDALLGRGAAAASTSSNPSHEEGQDTAVSEAEEQLNLVALRGVFRRSRVRSALADAAGTSLDPESLLLHLTSIASSLEEDGADERAASHTSIDDEAISDEEAKRHAQRHGTASAHAAARMQRTLLTLEVMEAVLEGVVPTSVSASAVLEQTTQLELLLTSSFMKRVEAAQQQQQQQQQQRAVVLQHVCTIRQCRAVTALCLHDLGSQQIHDYLVMLDETLWQLSTDVGQLIGTLTLTDLQPLLEENAMDGVPSSAVSLLLPSLVQQRLSLARTVTAALGTSAGPAQQLHDMVAYMWDCIQGKDHAGRQHHLQHRRPPQPDARDYVSLLLASQMNAEDWVSLVALGKEKHARAAMMALLARSSTVRVAVSSSSDVCAVTAANVVLPAAVGTVLFDTAWLSCCLRCIPGTTLRALVDVYVTLSAEELCDEVLHSTSPSSPSVDSALEAAAAAATTSLTQQWSALVTSLIGAYGSVGHNPYWPTVLTHTVRAIAHLARAWRKLNKSSSVAADAAVDAGAAASSLSMKAVAHFTQLAEQLLGLVLCVVRSEPRAAEVLRKALVARMRASATTTTTTATPPQLSRSGMSVAYVESIKVPATVLSDLGAPASLAEADADAVAAQVAALKDLSFEEELRELCELLFHARFVKHLFFLEDLLQQESAAAGGVCMGAMAFLYQVSLSAAQAAWRARATGGSLQALRDSQAVTFVVEVAHAFHARARSALAELMDSNSSNTSNNAAALMAFLEPFHADEDQYLFLHIASQRSGAAEAASTESGALDEAAKCWRRIFCLWATSTVTLMVRMTTSGVASATSATAADHAASTNTCEVFRVLFARLLASAQHTRRTSSKGGGPRTHGSGNGAGKRSRHDGAKCTSAEHTAQPQQPMAHAPATATKPAPNEAAAVTSPGGALTELLRAAFFDAPGSPSINDDDDDAAAHQFRETLSHFFCLTPSCSTSTDAASSTTVEGPTTDLSRDRVCQGDESSLCAWWLLWKLFTTFATHNDVLVVHNRVRTLLATENTASSTTTDDNAVALRACSRVLCVLPADTVPLLFFDHLHNVLLRVIPAATAGPSRAPADFSGSVIAAAELLLQLFRVRPRLPAWRLLPHAQRLLVWLTHPRSRTAVAALNLGERMSMKSSSSGVNGPSLCLLGIRLCSAVAAHPLIASSSVPSPSSSSFEFMMGYQSPASATSSHSARRPGVVASELMDNAWLLLLSLLQGGTRTAPPSVATATTTTSTIFQERAAAVELQESEILHVIVLLTKTWLRGRHQQLLWSRPAMLPPVMCALFDCVMRGVASTRYSPRVLSVLAGGLAAMAAHVDAATAAEGDGADPENADAGDFDGVTGGGDVREDDGVVGTKQQQQSSSTDDSTVAAPLRKRQKAETTAASPHTSHGAPPASARMKRMALTATTTALFEVAKHYVHVFTTFSSDMDFLFTDLLRVLSQHFLPKVTRPPIPYHAGVRIGGSTQSEVTFADLAYLCVGNAESKSLLKQAALRMEEEEESGGAAGAPGLTEGSRSIFHVV